MIIPATLADRDFEYPTNLVIAWKIPIIYCE